MPQFSKYLLVGGSAALLEYLLFLLGSKSWAWPLWLAHGLGFTAGLLLSFFLNKFFVFAGQQSQKVQQQLLQYVSLALLNLVLGYVLLLALVSYAGFYPWLAKGLSMVCVALWNFFILADSNLKCNSGKFS